MTSIKTEAKNGLVINQFNISNSIQITLTKFAATVLGSHLVILFLIISTLEEFLISIGVTLQTFDAKYLNEFIPNFMVLTVFLKKSVCDLKLYSLILW